MDGTSTNEDVGLRVVLCMKRTPGNPILVVRRKAIESFSCYRWVFPVVRLEKRGKTTQVPRPPAKFWCSWKYRRVPQI
jgi:hypothetical protein